MAPRDQPSRAAGAPVQRILPQSLLALALVLSAGLLGWYAWHGFETYNVIETVREMCLRSDQIRDQYVDLGHDLLITSHQGVAATATDPTSRYNRWSKEMDELLDQAAALEQQWLGEDHSTRLRDAKEALDARLDEVKRRVRSGDREGALELLDSEETSNAHAAFHDAANTYVQSFRERFQVFLSAERREHLFVVTLASVGFLFCVAVWFFLVEWLRRSRFQLIHEMEQRRAAEAEARLLQKTEILGEIAGGIAHDFNNVLTAISGLSSLTRKDRDDAEAVARHLDQIDAALRQAGSITGALLRFGRHAESEKSALDLSELASRTLPMLRSTLAGSIELEVDVSASTEPLVAEGNDLELQQVIVNLVLNARDALADQPDPWIRLRVRPAKDPMSQAVGIELVVEDNGCGMTPEVKERAPEPFFTTKAGGRGTGLGVPVAQRIVFEHGGNLWFESAPSQGTRAHVWLPIATMPVVPRPPVVAEEPIRGEGDLVLLAEDHPLVRQAIQENLRAEGFEVLVAEDGPTLLKLFEKHSTDVRALVVDYDMPGRNGIECIQDVRAAGHSTPAIMISGVADRELEDRVSGLALLLRKPFAVADLARLIRSVIHPNRPNAGIGE